MSHFIYSSFQGDLYAYTLFIQRLTNGNYTCTYVTITALLIVTATITTAGGLKAGMWTDLIHTLLMISGASALMVLGTKL